MRTIVKNYGCISDGERIKRLTKSIVQLEDLGYTDIVKEQQAQVNELIRSYFLN